MTDQELQARWELAQAAYSSTDWEIAKGHYEQILLKTPRDWKANFYFAICRANSCSMAEFDHAVDLIKEPARRIISLLPDEEHLAIEAINEITSTIRSTLNAFHMTAQKFATSPSDYDLLHRRMILAFGAAAWADRINELYGKPELQKLCVPLYETAVFYEMSYIKQYPTSSISNLRLMTDSYVGKIRHYVGEYKNPIDEMLSLRNGLQQFNQQIAQEQKAAQDAKQMKNNRALVYCYIFMWGWVPIVGTILCGIFAKLQSDGKLQYVNSKIVKGGLIVSIISTIVLLFALANA